MCAASCVCLCWGVLSAVRWTALKPRRLIGPRYIATLGPWHHFHGNKHGYLDNWARRRHLGNTHTHTHIHSTHTHTYVHTLAGLTSQYWTILRFMIPLCNTTDLPTEPLYVCHRDDRQPIDLHIRRTMKPDYTTYTDKSHFLCCQTQPQPQFTRGGVQNGTPHNSRTPPEHYGS